jgi:hypothetical protein
MFSIYKYDTKGNYADFFTYFHRYLITTSGISVVTRGKYCVLLPVSIIIILDGNMVSALGRCNLLIMFNECYLFRWISVCKKLYNLLFTEWLGFLDFFHCLVFLGVETWCCGNWICFRNVVFLLPRTPNDGSKKNPVILCAIHHCQNPVKSTVHCCLCPCV